MNIKIETEYPKMDKILDFVFEENLTVDEREEIERMIIKDEVFHDIVSGTFKMKRDYKTREAVELAFQRSYEKGRARLIAKGFINDDQRPETDTSDRTVL